MASRNITITLDQEVARWARVAAAERDTSLARFVGEVLREKMAVDRAYTAAMERFLAVRPSRLKAADQRYPTRDEVHDRRTLR